MGLDDFSRFSRERARQIVAFLWQFGQHVHGLINLDLSSENMIIVLRRDGFEPATVAPIGPLFSRAIKRRRHTIDGVLVFGKPER